MGIDCGIKQYDRGGYLACGWTFLILSVIILIVGGTPYYVINNSCDQVTCAVTYCQVNQQGYCNELPNGTFALCYYIQISYSYDSSYYADQYLEYDSTLSEAKLLCNTTYAPGMAIQRYYCSKSAPGRSNPLGTEPLDTIGPIIYLGVVSGFVVMFGIIVIILHCFTYDTY